MSFTGNFTIAQSGTSTLTLTDTSVGSDLLITERRIYLTKWDTTTIVPSGTTTEYIVWAIADDAITLTNILDRDYALNVTVIWVTTTVDPDNVYTVTYLSLFTAFTYQFLGMLTSWQARNRKLLNNKNYFNNKMILYTSVKGAGTAVDRMVNIYDAQMELDTAYEITSNQTTYFS